VVKGAVIKVTVSMGEEPPIVPMPNLIGQTKDDAMIWLRGEKMNPLVHEEFHDEVEEGRVIRTDPAEGTELKAGQTVHVYISKGPVIQKAKMPLVEDLKLAEKNLHQKRKYQLNQNLHQKQQYNIKGWKLIQPLFFSPSKCNRLEVLDILILLNFLF
jgi:beta-lactam-binding protein with PASTA domain